MVRGTSFGEIVACLAEKSATAGNIVDAIDNLKGKRHTNDVARYLSENFGKNEKITRVLIRAAGRASSRELHDLLAKRLMDRKGGEYLFELIEALGECDDPEYSAVIIPFLKPSYGAEIQSTAVYALGRLSSPLAISPLVRTYRKSDDKLKQLSLEALRKILKDSDVSVDIYLFSTPAKLRDEIRATVYAGP